MSYPKHVNHELSPMACPVDLDTVDLFGDGAQEHVEGRERPDDRVAQRQGRPEQRQKGEALFAYGYLKLAQKALAECLFWTVCRILHDRIRAAGPDWLPPELDALDDALVDQMLCDFSVFQSLMDHWALGQRFPIMPLSGLDREPDERWN